MKHFIKRKIRHIQNISANLKDYTQPLKKRIIRVKNKMIPNQYSFLHSEKQRQATTSIQKPSISKHVHNIRRFKRNFKSHVRSAFTNIDSARKKVIPDQYSFWHMKKKGDMDKIANNVKTFNLNHKNIGMLLISIALALFLLKSGFLDSLIPHLTKFGYFSVFALGILFPLGFTTAIASAAIYTIAPHFNPLLMALVASAGAMLGNLIIYFFVKYEMLNEVKHIFTNDLKLDFYKFELTLTKRRLKSKAFRILVPVFSGLLIALPIPTEMFVSIFWNITKVKTKYVLLLSFIFSFIGLFFLGSLH
jgi:hypothetical protein